VDPHIQELLAGAIAASSGLTALFMILRYKIKLKGTIPAERLERLLESQELILQNLDEIREEIGAQQGDMQELSGRVEFAERLLANAREKAGN
jgi:hypothetical protein